MLWVKVFHLVFLVCWFAGLFYLPRLFVYHATTKDPAQYDLFCQMERRLYWGIMTPSAFLTLATGLIMTFSYAWATYEGSYWLPLKFVVLIGLFVYHGLCGRWMKNFALGVNHHSHRFFRLVNEIPFLLLLVIISLVLVKPF